MEKFLIVLLVGVAAICGMPMPSEEQQNACTRASKSCPQTGEADTSKYYVFNGNDALYYGCTYDENGENPSISACLPCGDNQVYSETCQECLSKYQRDNDECSPEGTTSRPATTITCPLLDDSYCVNNYTYVGQPTTSQYFYSCYYDASGNLKVNPVCQKCGENLVFWDRCGRCAGPVRVAKDGDCPEVGPTLGSDFCSHQQCEMRADGDYEKGEGMNEYYSCVGGYCYNRKCATQNIYYAKVCGACVHNYTVESTYCEAPVATSEPATTRPNESCPPGYCDDKMRGNYADTNENTNENGARYFQCTDSYTGFGRVMPTGNCYVRYCTGKSYFAEDQDDMRKSRCRGEDEKDSSQ